MMLAVRVIGRSRRGGRVLKAPPVWAGVAVLFAAMPRGVDAYLIANRYKIAEPTASAAVAVSTALSVVTVSIWLVVIGAA